MNVQQTAIAGVIEIMPEPAHDERGFFARWYDRALFDDEGLLRDVCQANVSWNARRLTLRGLHYQAEPEPDPKIVRCISGAVYDVVVDLRVSSHTYLAWHGAHLDAMNRLALHVPAGCAHGFLTLTDDAEMLYLMGASYRPELARGVRWDDDAFGIEWPDDPAMISTRDLGFPDYQP